MRMAIDSNRLRHLESLANKLGQSWLENTIIEGPNVSEIPTCREEAYFVQDRMSSVIGQEITGWKVGATSAKMRELDGHDDIIPGRIFSSVTFFGPVHELPFDRFPNARAETEFAFQLTEDIEQGGRQWSASDLKDKVSMHPAIEIIGNRHRLDEATRSQKSLMTVADNGGGIGFVFGCAFADWKDLDFRNHSICLQVDDYPAAETMADLINHLSARGISLKAGDFVSTGAATVPQLFDRGSHVKADFGIMGKIQLTFV